MEVYDLNLVLLSDMQAFKSQKQYLAKHICRFANITVFFLILLFEAPTAALKLVHFLKIASHMFLSLYQLYNLHLSWFC